MAEDPAIDTILLQSYRTHDVPVWMDSCMASVRARARHMGWDYEFMGDAFFSLAPEWVHKRCAGNLYAVTDICRLTWIQKKLAAGHSRVVWVDADVLVFDPQNLNVPTGIGHGFARELFLMLNADGTTIPVRGINNALMAFERGDPLLQTYLDACLACLQALRPGPVPRTALGPAMLSELSMRQGLNTLEGVGLFTLAIMQDIAYGDGALGREYLRRSEMPPTAANLCHFLRDATAPEDRAQFDNIYEAAVNKLLETKGSALGHAAGNG